MNPLMVVHPLSVFLVAAGGAFGCVARFLVIKQIARMNPGIFPVGTMVVNIIGSLLIGIILAKYGSVHSARAFFVSGMLGGFTTFSAFSWDALRLLQRGEWWLAGAYVLGSVALSLVAVAFGYWLAREAV